jgi:hypothetical protein
MIRLRPNCEADSSGRILIPHPPDRHPRDQPRNKNRWCQPTTLEMFNDRRWDHGDEIVARERGILPVSRSRILSHGTTHHRTYNGSLTRLLLWVDAAPLTVLNSTKI